MLVLVSYLVFVPALFGKLQASISFAHIISERLPLCVNGCGYVGLIFRRYCARAAESVRYIVRLSHTIISILAQPYGQYHRRDTLPKPQSILTVTAVPEI